MASQVTHLPHILNTEAGRNFYDPVHSAIFEVYFSLPKALRDAGFTQEDEAVLTEQVKEVSGLEVLQKTVAAGSQKFFGVDVSFLNPHLDQTYAEVIVTFNLNLRNVVDNYVLKIFKAWGKLGYDMADGTRTLMADYVADNLRIAEGNRDGSIWRAYVFHKVMVTNIQGLGSLNYETDEAQTIQVTFRADWWDEALDGEEPKR